MKHNFLKIRFVWNAFVCRANKAAFVFGLKAMNLFKNNYLMDSFHKTGFFKYQWLSGKL